MQISWLSELEGVVVGSEVSCHHPWAEKFVMAPPGTSVGFRVNGVLEGLWWAVCFIIVAVRLAVGC